MVCDDCDDRKESLSSPETDKTTFDFFGRALKNISLSSLLKLTQFATKVKTTNNNE